MTKSPDAALWKIKPDHPGKVLTTNVHPMIWNFAQGHNDRVMISTKQDADKSTAYYTPTLTTLNGTGAQSEDAKVTITACILPQPPAGYQPPIVYFEVTDPDDLSHYEGKTTPGTPDIQGDANPNDNRDSAKRMTWNSGAPAGYTAYQTATFSTRSATPISTNLHTQTVGAAETTLNITTRYAGDNYKARATLRNPNSAPFDALSGMTNAIPYLNSTIKASETLIAWKRVYIEQDEMYTNGCTIVRDFAPVAGTPNGTVHVDSSSDFNVGDVVKVFWKGGEVERHVMAKTATTMTISNLVINLPKYAGIRPLVEPGTFTVSRSFLPDSFGSTPDGSDGGAFIEFKDAPSGNGKIPKYAMFPNENEELYFAKYWFDNSSNRTNNLVYLLGASSEVGRSFGVTFTRESICNIYCRTSASIEQREETTSHEIGHCLGLIDTLGVLFSHIDNISPSLPSHDDRDVGCLMSYSRNRSDSVAEFCIDCLLNGSSPIAGDSLRDSPNF